MWLKIKVWSKVAFASALALYVLLFVYNNTGKQVDFWWWFGHTESASVFTLSLIAFLSGVVATILVRTTWKTVKQIRELQRRSRQVRTERELADMKSKAGMLKTRTSTSASSSSSAPNSVESPAADAGGMGEP